MCSPKYTRQVWSDLRLLLHSIDSALLLSRIRRISIASSVDANEQTIRLNEGRGEKELRVAMAVIRERMSARDGGWKSFISLSLVIRRVFDGGEGCERGGRSVRSSERLDGRFLADGDAASVG